MVVMFKNPSNWLMYHCANILRVIQKWPPFCSRHIQIAFLVWQSTYIDSDVNRISSRVTAELFSIRNRFGTEQTRSYYPILWWRHQMETFSALLAICVGNSPVTGEFPSQRPVTRSWCFLWSAPEQTAGQTIETLVIWDAIKLIMASL